MLERYGIYFDTSKLVFYNNSGSEQTLMVFFAWMVASEETPLNKYDFRSVGDCVVSVPASHDHLIIPLILMSELPKYRKYYTT
jgi:hypothetical protein